MYVEHWCEEHFNSLTLGSPDFSHVEMVSFVLLPRNWNGCNDLVCIYVPFLLVNWYATICLVVRKYRGSVWSIHMWKNYLLSCDYISGLFNLVVLLTASFLLFCFPLPSPLQLPRHIEILVAAVTQINEPDSLYGIIQSHKVSLYIWFSV